MTVALITVDPRDCALSRWNSRMPTIWSGAARGRGPVFLQCGNDIRQRCHRGHLIHCELNPEFLLEHDEEHHMIERGPAGAALLIDIVRELAGVHQKCRRHQFANAVTEIPVLVKIVAIDEYHIPHARQCWRIICFWQVEIAFSTLWLEKWCAGLASSERA